MKLLSFAFLILPSMIFPYFTEKEQDDKSMGIHGRHSDVRLPNIPDIPKIEYPDLPENVPNVKNLIDFSNQVIELFNHGQLDNENVSVLTSRKWKENIIEKAIREDRKKEFLNRELGLGTPVVAGYRFNSETEKQELESILVFSVRVFHGKRLWLVLGIHLKNDKIDFIISDFFGNANDTYVVLKFFDDETKFLSLTFDEDKPMPWVKWDKEGKIQKQGTKTRLQIEQESKLPLERIIHSSEKDTLLRIIENL